MDALPDLCKIPDCSHNEYERWVFAFRLSNENWQEIVIRGVQPQIQLPPRAEWADPVVTLSQPLGGPLDVPLVVQSRSKVDVLCEFRLRDNTPRYLRFEILICASTPKKNDAVSVEVFRDRDEKQVYFGWQDKEQLFSESRLPAGVKDVNLMFRKKLSAPPKIIQTTVEKRPESNPV